MKLTDFPFALKPLFATLIAVILVDIIIKIRGIRFFDKKRKYHNLAGTVIHQLFNFTRLLDYMVDRTNQSKTYRLLSFIRSEVFTANPVNIEYILTTNFSNYGKVTMIYAYSFHLLSHNCKFCDS
ncbi:unnamed protein product [Sphenostylis stenocarpa]|uniref:Uncharacterized protein n=1 Tax=Sphenostylis stenocarpa TaxID=92480 RepID=A0AA86W2R8_9FABA|nr:unnamed protein product [Sphenostylis stenocarpa]